MSVNKTPSSPKPAQLRWLSRIKNTLIYVVIMWGAVMLGGQLRSFDHPLLNQPLPELSGVWLTNPSEKPQLIYLFAPWCQVCHMSMGNLSYLEQFGFSAQAYALSYQNREEVEALLKEKGLTLPVYLVDKYEQHQLAISAYPSYFIIKEGKVVSMHVGYTSTLGMLFQLLWHNK